MIDSFHSELSQDTQCGQTSKRPRPRVWLFDSLCFTPWYTSELAHALGSSGANVRLICGPFSREPRYFQRSGLLPAPGPVHLAHLLKRAPALIKRAARVGEVMLNHRALALSLRHKRGAQPDLLHLQQLPMLNQGLRSDFALIDAAQHAGIPVVHTVHNLLPHDTGESLRRTYAELYSSVDHLVCHSHSTANRLMHEFGISEHGLSVIPHGPLFAPKHRPTEQTKQAARLSLGIPIEQRVILWQGVLAPYKGLDVLLEAWKLYLRQRNTRNEASPLLLIAGSGPAVLESEIRRASAAIGSTVRADLRYISSDRLPLYYEAADILAYPYRSITTSGAMLTGLSYGKPIIASRLAAFEDYLVDGGNALLVPPEDTSALADALSRLLTDDGAGPPSAIMTSSLYAQLAAGAEKNESRCTGWPEIADRTMTLYRDLLARKSSV